MASTIQVDKIQDTGGNTILSSNSTGTFTYEAASGANFTALAADNISAGTLAIARGGTGAATLAAAGLDNTPAFAAEIAATQSISANTWTKVIFGTEVLDSNGTFASSAFTPTVAGWYWCHTSQYYELSDAGEANRVQFAKNGSRLSMYGTIMRAAATDQDMILEANALLYLDGDDYLEVYMNSYDAVTLATTNSHIFQAFRIIGV